MRTSKYSEQQIIGFLNRATAGEPVAELCRKEGFSHATFYKWRAKYGAPPRSRTSGWNMLELLLMTPSSQRLAHLENLGVPST